jgi:hypothetical protein
LSRAVRENARALRELGTEHLKRGSVALGETGFVTPTGHLGGRAGGFGAVGRALSAVHRLPGAKLFSFDLVIRYRGPREKIVQEILPRIGVPTSAKSGAELGAKVRSIIHDSIFKEVIPRAFGKYPAKGETGAGARESAGAFRKRVAQIKERRGVTFKVRLYREVLTGATAKVDRGAGLGGRRSGKPVPLRNRQPERKLERGNARKGAGLPARPRAKAKRKV